MTEYQKVKPDTSETVHNLEKIPAELQERPQWVCWRWVLRKGKWVKVPVNAHRTGSLAKTDDPTTWSPFEQAVKIYQANPKINGIGYVFSKDDEFLGIDFDACSNTDNQIEPFARQWLAKLGGYQERSVSRTGIHAVVRARMPGGRGRVKSNPGGQTEKVELYDRKRFFCFTGLVRRDFEEIEESQQAVNEFLTSLFPPKPRKRPRAQQPSNLDDAELLDRARNSARGSQFIRLYDKGDISGYDHDHSRADYALISTLIFWTGGDRDRVINLFEGSALYRDSKHAGYVGISVDNALASYDGDLYDEKRARQAVWRILPDYFDLLLKPMWTERKAVSAFKAYAALLVVAAERGVKVEDGIRVGIDVRTLAEACNVGHDTLSRNALPWLSRSHLVRWKRGKGERAGHFLLATPTSIIGGWASNTRYTRRFLNSVGSSPTQSNAEYVSKVREVIRLCYGVTNKADVKRLGSLAAIVLMPLVRYEARGLKLEDVASMIGRCAKDTRRILQKLKGARLVAETDAGGRYYLPTDFWERLATELEKSGITEAERLRKFSHDSHREARKLYKDKPADKVPERPKKRGSSPPRGRVKIAWRQRRDEPDEVHPRPPAGHDPGEVQTRAPHVGRDPLVHRDTEKAKFFTGGSMQNGAKRELTPEQERKMQKVMREGMLPHLAEAAVRGEEVSS